MNFYLILVPIKSSYLISQIYFVTVFFFLNSKRIHASDLGMPKGRHPLLSPFLLVHSVGLRFSSIYSRLLYSTLYLIEIAPSFLFAICHFSVLSPGCSGVTSHIPSSGVSVSQAKVCVLGHNDWFNDG